MEIAYSTRCRDCGARINAYLHPNERCSTCQLDRELEHTHDPIHRAHLERFNTRLQRHRTPAPT